MSDAAGLPEFFTLLHLDTVDSTNEEAKRQGRNGARAGTIVWADAQTAGRGRLGRVWDSPRGNLYFSILLRPKCTAAAAPQLGFGAALAVGEALAPLLPDPAALKCKWPNDVLVGGRKIAGILMEAQSTSGKIDSLVVGFGVNLVSHPAGTETPATSLAACGAETVSPASLLTAIATRFLHWRVLWRAEGFAPLRAAWLDRAHALGDEIKVRGAGPELRGRFVDLDADGALILEGAAGRQSIQAGAIFPAA